MKKSPIVLIAFNRPGYFKQVCDAIAPQSQDRDVYLFLDGPQRKLNLFQINAIKWLFKIKFPDGHLYASDRNLGVAFNTKRAMETVFERHERSEKQEENKSKLIACSHTYAIGMWAKKYEKIKPVLYEYYKFLPTEYQEMPRRRG